MLARLFAIVSLAALAVAVPAPLAARQGQCSTGPIQCCQSVQDASTVAQLLQTAGIADVLAGVTGQVATGCSPISAVGAGNTCTQQPVCCNGDTFNGLINIGCTPINVVA